MRVLLIVPFLFCASICHAEDPLESLNTVEETLRALSRYREVRQDGALELPSALRRGRERSVTLAGRQGLPATVPPSTSALVAPAVRTPPAPAP